MTSRLRSASGNILPFAVAAIPLAIAPGLLFFFDVTPKILLLYCATALALPFANLRRLRDTRSGQIFSGLVALTFLSILISTVFSVRPELSLAGTNWRRFGLFTQSALLLFTVIVAADFSRGPDRIRAYLRASTLATLLVSSYAILQYFGWDPWLDPATYHIGSGEWTIVRPPATLGYVTYLANYLVFGVFQALALFHLENRPVWRWTSRAALLLAPFAIILSGTRAAEVALVAGALVLWWTGSRRLSPRLLKIFAAFALLFVVFFLSPAGTQLRSRLRWFREDPAGGARLYLWRDSFRLMLQHPLLGSGPESFSIEFPRVQSEDLSRAFPEFYHESAHNMFLDAGAAQGIPGFIILSLLVLTGLRAPRPGPEDGAWFAGFVAIVVCHQFSVFTVPTAMTFWITLAMLVFGSTPASLTPAATAPDRRMLLLLPVSAAFLIVGMRMGLGDLHLGRMRIAIEKANVAQARSESRTAGRWGMHADLWYSRKLLGTGRQSRSLLENVAATQDALAAALSATRTAEDTSNAWMNLGLVYASLNNVEQTEHSIRQAIQASPNWYKPHLALAQLLVATHRMNEGTLEFDRAKILNPQLTLPR